MLKRGPDSLERKLGADRPHRPWHRTVIALIVVGGIVAFAAATALWANRQALDTERWTTTSVEVLDDEDVQDALAPFLVDVLFDNVDVRGELREALPSDVEGLAGPGTGGLRALSERLVREGLDLDETQAVWREANRLAHEALLFLIEDGEETPVFIEDDAATLQLRELAEAAATQIGVDGSLAAEIPDDAAQVEIVRSDELPVVQGALEFLRGLALVLPLLTLAIWGGAIYLADGWRREALRDVGIAFVAVGGLLILARAIAGPLLADSLAETPSAEPAIESTWSIASSTLADIALAMILYGVVVAVGAAMAAPSQVATRIRGWLAPIAHSPVLTYAAVGLFLLILFLISPIEGTRRLIPSLVLVLVVIVCAELLRRQMVAEHPEESLGAASERWRERAVSLGDRARRTPKRRRDATVGGDRPEAEGGAPETEGVADTEERAGLPSDRDREETRIDHLERLNELKRSGGITEEEYELEKGRVLGRESDGVAEPSEPAERDEGVDGQWSRLREKARDRLRGLRR